MYTRLILWKKCLAKTKKYLPVIKARHVSVCNKNWSKKTVVLVKYLKVYLKVNYLWYIVNWKKMYRAVCLWNSSHLCPMLIKTFMDKDNKDSNLDLFKTNIWYCMSLLFSVLCHLCTLLTFSLCVCSFCSLSLEKLWSCVLHVTTVNLSFACSDFVRL